MMEGIANPAPSPRGQDDERYEVGPFRIDVSRRTLVRVTASGETQIAIGSRAFDVLTVLARSGGLLVTKAALLDAVWPDAAVEENNLTVQISALRRALGNGQTGERWIETVPGRGYRLVTAASAAASTQKGSTGGEPDQPALQRPHLQRPSWRRPSWKPLPWRSWQLPAAALMIVSLVAIVALGAQLVDSGDERPAMSLMIVPLTPEGGDATEVADKVTSDLLIQVARLDGVVLRRATPAPQLSVRYLVEGGVRHAGDGLSVNARLVEADTRTVLWSASFDGSRQETVSSPDAVVNRITSGLLAPLLSAEASRLARDRRQGSTPAALTIQARALDDTWADPISSERAVALLRRALELDPAYLPAMSALGNALTGRPWRDGEQAARAAAVAETRLLLRRASAINPQHGRVLALKARLLRLDGRWQEAAVLLSDLAAKWPFRPSLFDQWAECALMLGRPEEAIALIRQAQRLEPGGARAAHRHALAGEAMLALGRDEEAVTALRLAVQLSPPGGVEFRERLASALARAGHLDSAELELQRWLEAFPCVTVARVRHVPASSSDRLYWNALADGLALAGLRLTAADTGRVAPLARRCTYDRSVPDGVTRIDTDALHEMLAGAQPPILLQTLHADVAIPGTHWVDVRVVQNPSDPLASEHLRLRLQRLTNGNTETPIVTIAWNLETAAGAPLARLVAAFGYRHVYAYTAGLEAWTAAGLPVEQRTDRSVNSFD